MPEPLGEVDVVVRVVTDPMEASLARARRSAEQFERQSSQHMQHFREASEKAAESAEVLRFAMEKLREVMLVAGLSLGIEKFIELTSAWTDLNSRLKEVTGSSTAARVTMDRLVDVANRTYTPVERTVEGFLELSESLKGLGISTKTTLDFQEALNDALVVSGAKGGAAAAVQEALTRAMATGQLHGIQLNTVLQRGTVIASLLAEELGGKGPQSLRRFAQEGRITSDVILQTLLKNLDKLREEADAMPATLKDALVVRMGNSIMEFVGRVDEGIGASTALAKSIVEFSVVIHNSIGPTIGIVNALLASFDRIMADLGLHTQFAAAIAQNFFGTILGVVALRSVLALTVALGRGLVGALNLVSAAMLRNPLGLIVTAAVSAGIAIYHFRDQIKQSMGIDVVEYMKDFVNAVIGGFMIIEKAIADFGAALPQILSGKFAKMGQDIAQSIVDGVVNGLNAVSDIFTFTGQQHMEQVILPTSPQTIAGNKAAAEALEQFKKDVQDILKTDYVDWLKGAATATTEVGEKSEEAARAIEHVRVQLDSLIKAEEKLSYEIATTFFTPEQKAVAEVLHSVYNEQWQSHMNDAIVGQAKLAFHMQQQKAALDAIKQTQFQIATSLMNPSERAAAEAVHGIFDDQWQSHMHDAVANMARFNEQLNEAYTMTRDFTGTLVHGLLEGKKAVDVLTDAFKNLANRLIDMALDAVIQGLFKILVSGVTGGTGGFLSSLIGVAAAGGGGAAKPVGMYQQGGRVGSSGVPLWRGQRLKRDEYPAILHVGETVVPVGGFRRRPTQSGRDMMRMFGGIPRFDSGFNAAAAAAGAYTAGDTGQTGYWSSVSGGGGNATLSANLASQYHPGSLGGGSGLTFAPSGGGGSITLPSTRPSAAVVTPRLRPVIAPMVTPRLRPVIAPVGQPKYFPNRPGVVFPPVPSVGRTTYTPTWFWNAGPVIHPVVVPRPSAGGGGPDFGAPWWSGSSEAESNALTAVLGNPNYNVDPSIAVRLGASHTYGRPTTQNPPRNSPTWGSGGFYHSGGYVGSTPVLHRMFSSRLFARAPRLHDGLGYDEYPAILKSGERVTPSAGGGRASIMVNVSAPRSPPVVVNVVNNANANVSTKSQESDNGAMRLDIMIDELVSSKMNDNGSRISRAMAQKNARVQPIGR